VNFDQKTETWFDLQDFSWENHAYNLLNKYVPETADAYSQAMSFAFEMTKQNYGSEQIDTSYFRLAIRRYLMSINGIRDDSFNYQHVNQVLTRAHKVYIKKIMCEPEQITV